MNNLNFNKLNKTFIVAEIGVNHEGDVNCAKRMIDLAAKSGVDAVKFQTLQLKTMYQENTMKDLKELKNLN